MNIPFGENQWARFTCASRKRFVQRCLIESSRATIERGLFKSSGFSPSSTKRKFRRDFLTCCFFFFAKPKLVSRSPHQPRTHTHATQPQDEARSDTTGSRKYSNVHRWELSYDRVWNFVSRLRILVRSKRKVLYDTVKNFVTRLLFLYFVQTSRKTSRIYMICKNMRLETFDG